MTIINNTKIRRLRRVRGKLSQNINVPRLSVFRSNCHIWAQIIDDKHGKTYASASTKTTVTKGTKSEQAQAVGVALAKIAKSKKITFVRFDRGSYRYHGRVKALAEGARSGGLKF
ncbi:MAG: 50S ribosomal protein L18 [Candidatus Shapirobacteria bacterium GW2011_GWE1_38_10]|uniref:Large ribosomal subunit protein uL18 n=1 Tax=Candidatus Shapirobacteria bacterium GW2011_GWE1_38_10 TaxID=1618488 RepID=A0A0G0IGP5_9BACT|nr:MAG: 50S ribosomal protein L18 [Candidatus Shapirobacteria bacterium GW2011_GWF2_37_20]KKQ50155.1 MAG: 50S ribosomal protein L18 [Candidatus Shapirobacteria bacterium GW2011_GWE1_38_10]KKQ64749.1 MAG: 50S ribosomal protein L18 [Candidatus Shapirobacteria bacterium GW2011_GWF1_38_23]HBP50906.1 50S ribosomal protein L18 [Candidatus Shapirobacteria bacterium]